MEFLVDRIKVFYYKFIILYGFFGVGKSFLVEVGLILIFKGEFIDIKDFLLVL